MRFIHVTPGFSRRHPGWTIWIFWMSGVAVGVAIGWFHF